MGVSSNSVDQQVGSVNVAAALASAQSALTHLRASTGYKTAKQQNPKNFANTEMGKCEAAIVATINDLGGTA